MYTLALYESNLISTVAIDLSVTGLILQSCSKFQYKDLYCYDIEIKMKEQGRLDQSLYIELVWTLEPVLLLYEMVLHITPHQWNLLHS
jgi:hypothetical protein